ncbi:hypothetical protein ASG89_05575 [Paenibacillus sp. Soil766]|nr:hypothetical protein ASG89_05575 [Paenibacillus sp. Soil766]
MALSNWNEKECSVANGNYLAGNIMYTCAFTDVCNLDKLVRMFDQLERLVCAVHIDRYARFKKMFP